MSPISERHSYPPGPVIDPVLSPTRSIFEFPGFLWPTQDPFLLQGKLAYFELDFPIAEPSLLSQKLQRRGSSDF